MLHIIFISNCFLLGDGTSTAIVCTQCPESLRNVELGWLSESLQGACRKILRVLKDGIKAGTFIKHMKEIQGDSKRVMLNVNEVLVHLS